MSNILGHAVISLAAAAIVMLSVIIVGRLIDRLGACVVSRSGSKTWAKTASFIINRVLFIGTVFHELSHALLATLAGAKVTKIRCFVLFSKDTLGYVEFTTRGNPASRAMQECLSACAPVMTAFVTVPLFTYLALTYSGRIIWNLLFGYCAVGILFHASMSRTDVGLYKKGAVVVYPMLSLLLFAIIGLFF